MSQRLHTMCNRNSGSNGYNHDPTTREQELIQKLEEASDEIEALLKENGKLMRLSNELRFELQKAKGQPSLQQTSGTENQIRRQEHEHAILNAILTDQSRSCDSESHDELVVACIGHKPPMSSAADRIRSKTAYVRTAFHYAFASLFTFSPSLNYSCLALYRDRGLQQLQIVPPPARINHSKDF